MATSERVAWEALRLAQIHEGKGLISSAKLCAVDAERLYNAGDYTYALKRAIKSLKHSVGILHEDYKRACMT